MLFYLVEPVSINIVRHPTANPDGFSPDELSEVTNDLGGALRICTDVSGSGVVDLYSTNICSCQCFIAIT